MTNLSRRALMAGVAAVGVANVVTQHVNAAPDQEYITAVHEFLVLLDEGTILNNAICELEQQAGPFYITYKGSCFYRERAVHETYDPLISVAKSEFKKHVNDRQTSEWCVMLEARHKADKLECLTKLRKRKQEYDIFLAKTDHARLSKKDDEMESRLCALGEYIDSYVVETPDGLKAKIDYVSKYVDEEVRDVVLALKDDVSRLERSA